MNTMQSEQPERTEIIEAYGAVLEQLSVGKSFLTLYDEKTLPYPKPVIMKAIFSQLQEYSYEVWRQHAKDFYDSLLVGLYSLVWFQTDLNEPQITMPNVERDDLSQHTPERRRALIAYIERIIDELKQTSEIIDGLKIHEEVAGRVDAMNTAMVIALHLTKEKLKNLD